MLIYLADLAHTFSTKNESLMIPLNVGFLKAYALKHQGDKIEIKIFKNPNDLLGAIYFKNPDLLGLSNYGWNEDLNYKIGMHIKSEFPNTIIFAGGPNIDEGIDYKINFLKKKPYIDYYISDSGEVPFNDLITWIMNDKKDQMPNNLMCLNKNQELAESERNPLSKQSPHIVSPYLSGCLDEFLDQNMVPLIETNRGCPFRCTFCAWGIASHDIVSKLDINNTLQEIEYIAQRSNAKNWIICDANFGILKRDVEIAKAIKEVNNKYGRPKRCDIWLAKNATERNLEIAEILDDLIVPVIAIQSMNKNVLSNINRDNISSETYFDYQKKYHDLGTITSSDMMVPLPNETFKTHIDGLRELFSMGVDCVDNHNIRMLPGAEMNSKEQRKKYGMKTRYRLIHGDSGIYKTPDGKEIKSFELEESLRATNTMSEKQVFKLREIHFLVDLFCNKFMGIYGELFKVTRNFKLNQINIILQFIKESKKDKELKVFWKSFDDASKNEWFDSRNEAESYFSQKDNFNKVINQEYDKLNIQYSIIVLKDYKVAFDRVLLKILKNFNNVPKRFMTEISKIIFAQFPPLESNKIQFSSKINFNQITNSFSPKIRPKTNSNIYNYSFSKSKLQKNITDILMKQGTSISKILNTQEFRIRDLKRKIIQKKNLHATYR